MKRNFFIILGLLILTCTASFAQDVRVEATVNQRTIELGSTAQLTISIFGTQNVSPITLPDIEGLKIQYLGPSTRISIINGQYSQSVALTYTLLPLRTGTFQIPALTLTIAGQDHQTAPIDLEVVDAGTAAAPAQPGAQARDLQEKIFIVMGTPGKTYFLNEQIPLTIKLFVNGLSVQNIQYPEFPHQGFFVEDMKEPQRYQQVVGGVRYDVVEFKTYIYPTRTGALTLGPARLACNILFRRSPPSQRRMHDFGSLFDDDFFDDFFGGGYQAQTLTLESVDLALDIQPLPEEGRPEHFSGAVGQFQFDMSVSPAQVKVGDPVTVRLQVKGNGNLQAVELPSYRDREGLKTYEPQVKDEEGGKILEQVVIPTDDKVKELPAIEFTYFDALAQKYVTETRGPFPLQVARGPGGQTLRVVGGERASEGGPTLTETLGQDINFIKEYPGPWHRRDQPLYLRLPYLLALTGLLGAWLVLWKLHGFKHRLSTDARFAQRLHAPRYARSGLSQAKVFYQKNEPGAFYDQIYKTLQKYFTHKFHLTSGAVTLEVLDGLVRDHNLAPELVEKIRTVFAECEMVRYASGGADAGRMAEVLSWSEQIIDQFERNVK